MSFKIPCGGFKLDEKLFSLDKNNVLSIPKPLTYDYMPEGYPSKSEERVVLFPEQQLTFVKHDWSTTSFCNLDLDLVEGETYFVVWDGEIYECVCKIGVNTGCPYLGNNKNAGDEDTGEPFGYEGCEKIVVAYDGAETHTFGVVFANKTIVPLSEEFLPYEAMKANDPVGKGSFSMNRKPNSEIGPWSFAEGNQTTASGGGAHAEGRNTTASGENSHAEGDSTIASGNYSHAEGGGSEATGIYSHAEGYMTRALGVSQHAQGKHNIEDSLSIYAHIVGNGTSDTNRSNAHTLDWSGNAWFAGTVEGTAMIVKSSTAGSSKRFKITVDDSGTIKATEVT